MFEKSSGLLCRVQNISWFQRLRAPDAFGLSARVQASLTQARDRISYSTLEFLCLEALKVPDTANGDETLLEYIQ